MAMLARMWYAERLVGYEPNDACDTEEVVDRRGRWAGQQDEHCQNFGLECKSMLFHLRRWYHQITKYEP